jgi:hypothetical protein
VWARLNTDNASQRDCGLRVTAEVCGHGTEARERRLKSIGDQRRSIFVVKLPAASDHCVTHIQCEGDSINELARIGAALIGLKGVTEAAKGDVPAAITSIRQARKFLAELDAVKTEIPEVILPGGVTLKHALACVRIVKGLLAGKATN